MLRNILSTKINDSQVSIALLIMRLTAGVLMAHHGYQKLTSFAEIEPKFMEFLGLSKGISLGLVVGAEFFCSLLLVVGLATRFVLVPLVITMMVAVFDAHSGEIFGKGEVGALYLGMYFALLIAGAGKYSADGFLFNNE